MEHTMSENAVIVITGASTGIGKELAHCFAADGQALLLTARNRERLEALAESLRSEYGRTVYVCACDLAVPEGVEELLGYIEENGLDVDVLVNNAGYGVSGAFASSGWEDVQGMMQLNMTSLVALSYRLLPGMRARKSGGILNVASTAAFQPGPNFNVYCATKAFVLSFSEALYEELRGSGVRVTALCPGATLTEFQKRANLEKSLLFQRSFIPMVSVEEVARQGYQAFHRGKPLVVTGWMNRISVFAVRLVPRALVRKIAARLMRHE